MRHNGHREPEQIQADIERTRSELDHTLSAIEHRLTPGQLVDQGMDYLRRHGAREYVSNLGESVKRDPLPLALVGIGLAWLMASDRGRSGEPSSSHPTAAAIKERAAAMKERTSVMKERVARTTDRVSQAAQSARERVGQVGDTARHQAERLRDGYEHLVNDQPLAIGAIGLALGALLAAAMPRTAQEERLVAAAKERLEDEPPAPMQDETTTMAGAVGAELPPDASLVESVPRSG
jgi:ElaB/YqjD/DUF883 family membrane-anchored ribosome-binding protein